MYFMAILLLGLLTPLVFFQFHEIKGDGRFSDNHKKAECKACHSLVTGMKSIVRGNSNQACLSCHTSFPETVLFASFHEEKSRNCLDCHSFHRRDKIKAKETTFSFDFESSSLAFQCQSCHNLQVDLYSLSSGHRSAKAIYHSEKYNLKSISPSESCLICHSSDNRVVNFEGEKLRIPQFNEHASHPYNVYLDKKMLSKASNSVVFNNKVECQTCHILTSPSQEVAEIEDKNYNFCLDCHDNGYSVAQF